MSDNLNFSPEEALKKSNDGDKKEYAKLLHWLDHFSMTQLKKMVGRFPHLPKSIVEDVSQEVLITFHEKHKSWDENRPLMPWIKTLIKHKFLDHIKRKDFKVAINGCSLEEIENVFFAREDNSLIETEQWEKLLSLLSDKERKIIELAKLEMIPLKKIAILMNMSESNVKIQIFRAIKKLKANA